MRADPLYFLDIAVVLDTMAPVKAGDMALHLDDI
jgi:hypothetical protein